MKNRVARLLPVFALCWASAHASTLTYTDSGTFSQSTATSTFAGAGEPWAFSFQADSNPTVLESGNGGVSFAFSNFSYTLDGLSVSITPTFIRFFSAGNGGGWLMCFSGTTVASCTDGLGTATFGWPQMYTGMSSAPTLIPGAFTTDFAALVDGNAYSQANTTIQAVASGVPEPSTLLLLPAGVLALISRRLLFASPAARGRQRFMAIRE